MHPKQMETLLPKDIVAELDRHIVGQTEAKKSIAVAIRNRYRRSCLDPEWQREIAPSNVLMIGPTGVGKTEIVRRVSKLLGTPFVKVEATKFTEVGYVGRDVESMVRDLVEAAMRTVRERLREEVMEEAERIANQELLDLLVPKKRLRTPKPMNPFESIFGATQEEEDELVTDDREEIQRRNDQRTIFREKLKRLELEDEMVDIEIEDKPQPNEMLSQMGMDGMVDQMNDLMKKMVPNKKKKKRVSISEARDLLTHQAADRLIDDEDVAREAIALAENHGIIFIDEMDKIAESGQSQGPGVSREGVQRDILPIVEGSVVKTKHGPVKTDHILFIAAGAFHVAKPEDLIPELQGRFPVKVRLHSLSEADFVRILREPAHSLIEQYRQLLATDGCALQFEEAAIERLAELAFLMNENEEDLGARRLLTVMELLLRDLLFEAGATEQNVTVDRAMVDHLLGSVVQETNVDKYII